MPSEAVRCVDCGAPVRGVPAWLATANVSFTCNNCPKRPSRAPRLEPVAEPRALLADDAEVDLEAVDLEELDEEADLDLAADDLDEPNATKE